MYTFLLLFRGETWYALLSVLSLIKVLFYWWNKQWITWLYKSLIGWVSSIIFYYENYFKTKIRDSGTLTSCNVHFSSGDKKRYLHCMSIHWWLFLYALDPKTHCKSCKRDVLKSSKSPDYADPSRSRLFGQRALETLTLIVMRKDRTGSCCCCKWHRRSNNGQGSLLTFIEF